MKIFRILVVIMIIFIMSCNSIKNVVPVGDSQNITKDVKVPST